MTLTACTIYTIYGTWAGFFLGGTTTQIHILIESEPFSFWMREIIRLEINA